MSHIALARKWRPRTFAQLVGQEHVNKALINSLNQQRMHHAYLFTGTRGVGKTSVARLLAKALNCEQGILAEPCLQCDTCLAIEQGRFLDLIEVDGASRTRVEDTRELLENVQYSPTNGRFKIYLIDEVHMLSQHSFNALLKTLEEPPAHVKFLLATTDPQKLPVTVLSRCLQFNLKPIQPPVILEQLRRILDAEKVIYDVSALALVSQAAQGSMRDALSLLDQALAYSDNSLTAEVVKNMLGMTKQDYALKILDALAEFNPDIMLSLSRQIALEGGNFHYVLDELLSHLHQISIVQAIHCENPFITPAADILTLSKQFSAEDVQLFYQIAMKGKEELKLAPSQAIGFEMTLLRLHAFRPATDIKKPILAHQVQKKEKTSRPSSEGLPRSPGQAEPIQNERDPFAKNQTQVFCESEQVSTANQEQKPQDANQKNNQESWQTIINRIKLTGLTLSAAEQAEMTKKEGTQIFLSIGNSHRSLFTPSVISRIEKALGAYYKEAVKINLTAKDNIQSSPAKKKQVLHEKQQQDAEQSLQNDLFFQSLKKEFSAELVKNSIVSLENDL